jgi:hypothetical protein
MLRIGVDMLLTVGLGIGLMERLETGVRLILFCLLSWKQKKLGG